MTPSREVLVVLARAHDEVHALAARHVLKTVAQRRLELGTRNEDAQRVHVLVLEAHEEEVRVRLTVPDRLVQREWEFHSLEVGGDETLNLDCEEREEFHHELIGLYELLTHSRDAHEDNSRPLKGELFEEAAYLLVDEVIQ